MKRHWFRGLAPRTLLTSVSIASLAACSDDGPERFAGVVSYDDFPESAAGADRSDDLGIAHAFVLSAGFANGRAVQYLDLGDVNTVPAKVYILMRGGQPVAGQYPIVDTLPDDFEYSPFWQVVEVEVDGGYEANDIKSLKGLEDAGFEMTETMEAIHCPIVNPDATWVAADLSQTYTVFWGTGEEIPNPAFDPSAPIDDVNKPTLTDADATAGDIVLTPLWQKRLRAFCWSDDLERRYPLVDEDGTVSLDGASFGARFDTYDVAFGAGGELGAEPTDLLPVFASNVGEDGYSPVVLQFYVATLDGAQAGSVGDFDPDEVAAAEPNALLDNPIVFPLALDRFSVTIENTTPAEGDGSLTFSPGIATVEDGSAPIWFEGEPALSALAVLAASGDAGPLLTGFPVSGRPLSPTIDTQALPSVAPGETATVTVLASPWVPYFSSAQALIGLENGFTGVSEVPLYDENFEAVDSQSFDLPALITNAEAEDPEDPEATVEVVGPSPDVAAPVGSITIDLIAPGGNP